MSTALAALLLSAEGPCVLVVPCFPAMSYVMVKCVMTERLSPGLSPAPSPGLCPPVRGLSCTLLGWAPEPLCVVLQQLEGGAPGVGTARC